MAMFVKLLYVTQNQPSRRCTNWTFSFRYSGFKKRKRESEIRQLIWR